ALGIALYELLAGKQPYYADTLPQLCAEILTGTPTPIRSVRPEIPDELAQVIEKAYARDRAQRHQSVAELVIALAPFAPTRSQQMIDRVARMAGLPIPVAGTAGQRTSSPSAPPRPSAPSYPQQGGTQMMPQHYSPPPARAPQPSSPATEALPVMDPTAGGSAPPGMGPAIPGVSPVMHGFNQIVPDHYQAPASSRASAHFRQASIYPQTDGSMSAVSHPQPGSSKAGMVIAILGVLVVVAAAAALFLRPRDAATPPGSSVTGTEKTVETSPARPPDTGALPTATTTPPPADIKSAPPAVPSVEPPAKAAQPPAGGGARPPVKGAVAPTHAPVAPTPPPPTTPTVVKPPVNPLDPGGRHGSLWEPTKDRPV
ncbi:MAG: hypothetical protein ABI134_06080, partial [Byssovorax sp.]